MIYNKYYKHINYVISISMLFGIFGGLGVEPLYDVVVEAKTEKNGLHFRHFLCQKGSLLTY